MAYRLRNHGLQITEWFNEGDGSPASVFTENERPAYDRVLAGLGHTYSTLVAYAVDRLSRRGSGAIGHLLDLAEERVGEYSPTMAWTPTSRVPG